VLVLAARQGDGDAARHESIEQAQELLGDHLSVCWLSGGHDLPLERPDAGARALAALAAQVPNPVWRPVVRNARLYRPAVARPWSSAVVWECGCQRCGALRNASPSLGGFVRGG